FPAIDRSAAVLVGAGPQQVPTCIEGVDLKLAVVMAVAVRVGENLEIVVVVKYVGVVLGQRGPDMPGFPVGRNIEKNGSHEHLYARAITRGGPDVAFDVHEGGGPRDGMPRWFIETAVNSQRGRGAMADVAARMG